MACLAVCSALSRAFLVTSCSGGSVARAPPTRALITVMWCATTSCSSLAMRRRSALTAASAASRMPRSLSSARSRTSWPRPTVAPTVNRDTSQSPCPSTPNVMTVAPARHAAAEAIAVVRPLV